jgi:hypothetical protein
VNTHALSRDLYLPPRDAEFSHFGLQRGALHSEPSGGSVRTGDDPFRFLKHPEDMIAVNGL